MSQQSESLMQIALGRFMKNRPGAISLVYIAAIGIVAALCYVLAPDHSKNANTMHLSLSNRPPGTEVTLLEHYACTTSLDGVLNGACPKLMSIPLGEYRQEGDSLHYREFLDENNMGPEKQLLLTPDHEIKSGTFWLGTDKYGRDLLSRMLVGARISFTIGFIAVFISLVIGVTLGAIGGYFGGRLDGFIMWFINVVWSIPTLLMVIAITMALGKGLWQVYVAVGLTMWVEVARVVRGQVLSVKQQQYVEAARALGYNDFRIIFKHILPNIVGPVIVIAAANFASAILVESGLSFLGIGAQPPIPSWGGIIKDHYSYMVMGKPYLALIPGLAIMSLVLAFMLVGNALRDAFDVRS